MFALFRKDGRLSDLNKDLSLDKKTMPHVYVNVSLFLGGYAWAVTTSDKIAVYTLFRKDCRSMITQAYAPKYLVVCTYALQQPFLK